MEHSIHIYFCLYLHKERVHFREGRHVVLPCFYCSPERTNQTGLLESAFRVCANAQVGSRLTKPGINSVPHAGLPFRLSRTGREYFEIECENFDKWRITHIIQPKKERGRANFPLQRNENAKKPNDFETDGDRKQEWTSAWPFPGENHWWWTNISTVTPKSPAFCLTGNVDYLCNCYVTWCMLALAWTWPRG